MRWWRPQRIPKQWRTHAYTQVNDLGPLQPPRNGLPISCHVALLPWPIDQKIRKKLLSMVTIWWEVRPCLGTFVESTPWTSIIRFYADHLECNSSTVGSKFFMQAQAESKLRKRSKMPGRKKWVLGPGMTLLCTPLALRI
jgi:hypothetical protein